MFSLLKSPKRSAKTRRPARLGVERLDERINPAGYVYTWTGGGADGNWSTYLNWSSSNGFGFPGMNATDTAKFDSYSPLVHRPYLDRSVTLENLLVTSAYGGPIEGSGTITARASTLNGSGGASFVGPDLSLTGNSGLTGTNHDVTSMNFNNTNVDFNSYAWGTIEPGTSHFGDSTLVRTSAYLEFIDSPSNSHGIKAGGVIECDTTGLIRFNSVSIVNDSAAQASTHNLGKIYNNGGKIIINNNDTLSLQGAYYDALSATTQVLSGATLAVGDNYTYLNGTRAYTGNVDVLYGTVDMWTNSGISTTDGDQMYASGAFNMHVPGYYDSHTHGTINLNAGYVVHGGYGPPATSTMTFNGGSTHEVISFVDDNFGTVDQQAGARLYSTAGQIVLSGLTDLKTRLVMGGWGGGYDYVEGLKVNVDGPNLTLTVNNLGGTSGQPDPFTMYGLLRAATNCYTKTNNSGNPFKSISVTGLDVITCSQTSYSPANGLDIGIWY
jgi:hypothetical protein